MIKEQSMEDWKIYALAFFPELRSDLLEDYFSYYHVFFHLHAKVSGLYRSPEGAAQLEHYFAYGRWCLRHEDEDIGNGAIVAFYEHLFDHRENWEDAARWVISDVDVIRKCWPSWEHRTKPENLQELRELLEMDRFDGDGNPITPA
jgi:hypothetical protein